MCIYYWSCCGGFVYFEQVVVHRDYIIFHVNHGNLNLKEIIKNDKNAGQILQQLKKQMYSPMSQIFAGYEITNIVASIKFKWRKMFHCSSVVGLTFVDILLV